jgi:hypothetical protein
MISRSWLEQRRLLDRIDYNENVLLNWRLSEHNAKTSTIQFHVVSDELIDDCDILLGEHWYLGPMLEQPSKASVEKKRRRSEGI